MALLRLGVSRGQRNSARQGAALRSELPSPHCSKDLPYLAGENCTHIARNCEVKIFLFIFSNLLRFCLLKINHWRQAGVDRSCFRTDHNESSAAGRRCRDPAIWRTREPGFSSQGDLSVRPLRGLDLRAAPKAIWGIALRIVYFHSDTHPYERAIYPGVGPAFARPIGW